MRKIIVTRCDICTYVFVRMYKRCTMETIVSNTIGSVPDTYSARTIYVSKHVPWKAGLTWSVAIFGTFLPTLKLLNKICCNIPIRLSSDPRFPSFSYLFCPVLVFLKMSYFLCFYAANLASTIKNLQMSELLTFCRKYKNVASFATIFGAKSKTLQSSRTPQMSNCHKC